MLTSFTIRHSRAPEFTHQGLKDDMELYLKRKFSVYLNTLSNLLLDQTILLLIVTSKLIVVHRVIHKDGSYSILYDKLVEK